MTGVYGKELIVDLKNCDSSKFTRKAIEQYMIWLCDLIGMTRCELIFWDDLDVPQEERQTSLHTKGTSATQWILTSNITIHTLDLVDEAYINIHSCKEFNERDAALFTRHFFKGDFQIDQAGREWQVIIRGLESRV